MSTTAADHGSSSTPEETHRVSLQIEASKTRIQQLSVALKQEETNLERLEELKQSLEKAVDEEAASIPSVEPPIIQEVVSTNAGGAKRKAYQAVKPEVKEQVIQNVFERGMTQRKVSEWFGLSERTVRRIIKAEKSVHSGEAPGPKRRRGAKTKLSSGIMTELLFQLEMRPAMTLADMKRYVADHHAVSCTPQSISRMFSSMHVNWKTHLHIPPHWNDPHILQLRHDFVVRRAMDVDKDLIFVGDTGFDLNFNRSQDPSCLDQGATLSLVPRTSQATLIGAMSTQGYVHHEIINADGKRVTGVMASDYEEFLERLSGKLDKRRSVVIVDGMKLGGTKDGEAPVLRGRLAERFREPESLEMLLAPARSQGASVPLDPAVLRTEIDFLPPHSAFLSPIEISFVDLKAHIIAHPEPITERSQLIARINNAIRSLFPPPKPQDWFNFVAKEIYPNCFNRAPIDGPIIKHPDSFVSPP
ncbi:hypothetical protein PCASD_06301 [Puccinia coronata f. sp. avenae]|uniref:Uncharacterized protein n=1 Tax=Puccinia coronata f. sp. avenae TaxID=200324 RepID=A0A2N5V8X4_9BASI|nr:hypothetical protein PCASD_06301 [Puccinia coronata f. sp. avenae]